MAATKNPAPSATFDPTTLPQPLPPDPVPVVVDPEPPVMLVAKPDRASIVAWLRAHRTAEPADETKWRLRLATDIEAEKDKQ